MTVERASYPAPDHLHADALKGLREDALVLLPDTLSPVADQMVAGFREDAQALRVHAREQGLPVEVFLPKDSRAGHYAEHAADWVLPLILGLPVTVVAELIANEIQLRIDQWHRPGRLSMPTLRYREVVIDRETNQTRIQELEGPADEVRDVLIQRAGLSKAQLVQDEWQWPKS